MSLFSGTSIQKQWASRIESLLCVPVSNCDGRSDYICQKCKVRIVSLEKAAADTIISSDQSSLSTAMIAASPTTLTPWNTS